MGDAVEPARPQVLEQERIHVGRHPGAGVDAVGDVADRHLLLGLAGVEPLPHLARHPAVEGRDAVGAAGEIERQHGRAERRVGVLRVLGAEGHHLVERHLEPAGERLQVGAGEVGPEAVVPGLDRGVGGEAAHRRHLAQRRGGLDPLALDQLARPLQQGEGGVPLVEVQHRGLDAHHPERPVAADAEQDLLLDPHLLVAAVEAGGQRLVLGRVGVVAGVEQQEPAAPDVHPPDAQEDVAPGELDAEAHRLAVRPEHRLGGQLGAGDRLVEVLLPAVLVDQLMDVPLVVEQPDADDRRAQVAHALQVVPRQHPEAARVDGQRLVDAELGGEVGDRPGEDRPGVDHPPALGAVEIALQPAVGLVDAGLHLQVLHPAGDLLGGDPLQQGHRVVVDEAPGLRDRARGRWRGCRAARTTRGSGPIREFLKSSVDRFVHSQLRSQGKGAIYPKGRRCRPGIVV